MFERRTRVIHVRKKPLHGSLPVRIARRKQRFLAADEREAHALKQTQSSFVKHRQVKGTNCEQETTSVRLQGLDERVCFEKKKLTRLVLRERNFALNQAGAFPFAKVDLGTELKWDVLIRMIWSASCEAVILHDQPSITGDAPNFCGTQLTS